MKSTFLTLILSSIFLSNYGQESFNGQLLLGEGIPFRFIKLVTDSEGFMITQDEHSEKSGLWEISWRQVDTNTIEIFNWPDPDFDTLRLEYIDSAKYFISPDRLEVFHRKKEIIHNRTKYTED